MSVPWPNSPQSGAKLFDGTFAILLGQWKGLSLTKAGRGVGLHPQSVFCMYGTKEI